MIKTLIVEDNTLFRCTLCEILRARFPGMPVEDAEDGVEAMAKVARFQPDLILMDIQLPGESGLELCRCIRKEKPDTIIIICTSYDYPEYREAAERCGASHFVVKGGSTVEELLACVDRACEGLGPEMMAPVEVFPPVKVRGLAAQ